MKSMFDPQTPFTCSVEGIKRPPKMLLKVQPALPHRKFLPKAGMRRSEWLEQPPPVVQAKKGVLQSLKAVSREYCMESSICGLKRLVDGELSLFERIIWVLVMVVSLACSVSLVMLTFQQFNHAPLVTTQLPEGVPVNSILFPTISICTTNRISRTAAIDLAKTLVAEKKTRNRTESQTLELISRLGRLYDLETTNVTELDELHSMLGDYDVSSLLLKLTPPCKEVLVDCMWDASRRNCSELFEVRLTMNGFCCTFNYMRESDDFVEKTGRSIEMYDIGNKSSFGYDMGLRVVLKLGEHDNFYNNVPLYGALVTLTDAHDFPDAQSGSLRLQIVAPEKLKTIFLSATVTEASRDIQHVPVNIRGCLFYDESSYLPLYTNSDCLLKCRVLFLLDKCGCAPFNVPKMADARTCCLQDVLCLQNYTAQSITVQPPPEVETPPELELELVGGGISCPMCYPTCSKTVVSVVTEVVKIYPEFLNQVPDSEREPWLRGVNFTGLSLLHVKYGEEKASAYEQNIVMKWFDLVSNIGSTCGFVTGFSFVSLLEFFYFFTFKLFRTASPSAVVQPRQQKKGTKASSVDQAIYWGELARSDTKNFTITGVYSNHF